MAIWIIGVSVLVLAYAVMLIKDKRTDNIDQAEIDILVNNREQELREIIDTIPDDKTKQALNEIIDLMFRGI